MLKELVVSFVTNLFLVVLKLIAGIVGTSSALITDAIHSLSDLVTDVVAILGNVLSNKKEDSNHPFGHGKFEYIFSSAIGVLIIGIGITLVYNISFENVVMPSNYVIIVIILAIFIKYILSNYLIKNGKLKNNQILISSGLESRSDIYSSLVVLISAILMNFANQIELLKYSNMIGSIIVSILIIKTGYNVLKENISYLLEESVNNELLEETKEIIAQYKNIHGIKNIHLFKYGKNYKLLSTVLMNKNITLKKAHDIIDEIEDKLVSMNIKYVYIHMEPSK